MPAYIDLHLKKLEAEQSKSLYNVFQKVTSKKLLNMGIFQNMLKSDLYLSNQLNIFFPLTTNIICDKLVFFYPLMKNILLFSLVEKRKIKILIHTDT